MLSNSHLSSQVSRMVHQFSPVFWFKHRTSARDLEDREVHQVLAFCSRWIPLLPTSITRVKLQSSLSRTQSLRSSNHWTSEWMESRSIWERSINHCLLRRSLREPRDCRKKSSKSSSRWKHRRRSIRLRRNHLKNRLRITGILKTSKESNLVLRKEKKLLPRCPYL